MPRPLAEPVEKNKGGRPVSKYSIRRGGPEKWPGIYVFEEGKSLGYISLRDLCGIIKTKNLISSTPDSAQRLLKKQVLKLRGFRSTEEEPDETPPFKGKNGV